MKNLEKNIWFFTFLGILFVAGVGSMVFRAMNQQPLIATPAIPTVTKPTATPTPTVTPPPTSFLIPKQTHVFQSFNNCGPASLSMALSYMGMNITQQELGNALRPYQIAGGDNDDKSVSLQEVADHARSLGLNAYLRPNGTTAKMEQLISNGVPIVARTWLEVNEDIGHYRLIRGYNRDTQTVIQDDSLQGADLPYSYSEFRKLWQPFNYEYLVIVDDSKKEIVERILGEELDEKIAWQNAERTVQNELQSEPDNKFLIFALSRIYYYLGDYGKSIEYFDRVESSLSFRTLWYQIEPIQSLYELNENERLLSLTEKILNNQNRAFSELYYLRGKTYQKMGSNDLARSEFEKAVQYNVNNQTYQTAFNEISQ